MKHTDAEVDAVALAILNDDRASIGAEPYRLVDSSPSAAIYRRNARAALAARDALFETVWERILVRGTALYAGPYDSIDSARTAAIVWRRRGVVDARPVRVTTKRRKR
jgi:hypothetical protein